MYEEMVVLGSELAEELVSKGFELLRVEPGKYADYYYFVDSCELEDALIELVKL